MPRRLPDTVSWHVSGAAAGRPARAARAARPTTGAVTGRELAGAAGPGEASAAARRRLVARRRRLLMGLAGGLVLSVLLTGVGVLPWPVQLLVDLALVGYVIHLRGEARRAAAARARRGPAAGAARVAASARAVSPVGAPPVGPPLGAPPPSRREPAAFEPAEEPLERAVGLGDAWEPVPVPPPTYVTKSGSPEAPQHIVDLTHAGTGEIEDAIAEQVTEPLPRRPGLIDDLELWEDDEYGLDEILDGRRAVGD